MPFYTIQNIPALCSKHSVFLVQQQVFNLQLQEKVLVSSISFHIYSYLSVIDSSSPTGEVSYFSRQFQHSTPTTPLKISEISAESKNVQGRLPKGIGIKGINRGRQRGIGMGQGQKIQSHRGIGMESPIPLLSRPKNIEHQVSFIFH